MKLTDYLRKFERNGLRSSTPKNKSSTSTSESKKAKLKSYRPISKSQLDGFLNKHQSRRTQILKQLNPKRAAANHVQFHIKNEVISGNQRYRKGKLTVSLIFFNVI